MMEVITHQPGDPGYPETVNTPETPKRSFTLDADVIRGVITLMLIIAYVSLVFGRALGWIQSDFEDVFLASLVGMAIGYVYGKEVQTGKLKGP